MGEANDTNVHPSQEPDVTANAENSNVDEPVNGDPHKDSDHTIGAENTIVDEPDHTLHSVEVITVGEATDTNGYLSQEFDVQIDVKNSNVDKPDSIHDSSKTNDANAEQTESMEGSSVIIGEQNIVQDRVFLIQELLTTVDFNNDENQALNSEEVEWEGDSIGGIGDSTDYSEVENDFSGSTVKLGAKHIEKN